jgi:hypothetical protein
MTPREIQQLIEAVAMNVRPRVRVTAKNSIHEGKVFEVVGMTNEYARLEISGGDRKTEIFGFQYLEVASDD